MQSRGVGRILREGGADRAAKDAHATGEPMHRKMTFNDFLNNTLRRIRDRNKEEWNNGNRFLKEFKPKHGKIGVLHEDRETETKLRRIRLGHTKLTHEHLVKNEPAPLCTRCNRRLTVRHIVYECRLWESPLYSTTPSPENFLNAEMKWNLIRWIEDKKINF